MWEGVNIPAEVAASCATRSQISNLRLPEQASWNFS